MIIGNNAKLQHEQSSLLKNSILVTRKLIKQIKTNKQQIIII